MSGLIGSQSKSGVIGTITSIIPPAGTLRNVYFGSTETESSDIGDTLTIAVSLDCATGRAATDGSKFFIQGNVRVQTSANVGVAISLYRGSTLIWNGGTTVWDAGSNPNGALLTAQFLDDAAGLSGTITYHVKIQRLTGSAALVINYDDATHDQKSSLLVMEYKR
jgi:hypothetical protein